MDANETLNNYSGTENFYRTNFGFLYTDGVEAFCSEFESYWLLDIVLSYQSQLIQESFQVWTLTKNDDSTAIVSSSDGNKKILIKQTIPFTDFKAKTATIWVENDVMHLPSEH